LPGGNASEVSGCVLAASIPDLGLSEQYAIDAYGKTGASWLGGTGDRAVRLADASYQGETWMLDSLEGD
jgi:hypothetical protein